MKLHTPINDKDHIRGSLHATVVMVEYGDFECVHCAHAFPMLEQLLENFEDQLCFVFRHFPLKDIHPNAEIAALAAEAAGRQDHFWNMHRLLYQSYDRLTTENILGMANSLKLDLEQFRRDLVNDSVIEKIDNDLASGSMSGVHGTPTLFFNGELYDGTRSYLVLSQVVRSLASGSERRAA